jgi:hypothetical protein
MQNVSGPVIFHCKLLTLGLPAAARLGVENKNMENKLEYT